MRFYSVYGQVEKQNFSFSVEKIFQEWVYQTSEIV